MFLFNSQSVFDRELCWEIWTEMSANPSYIYIKRRTYPDTWDGSIVVTYRQFIIIEKREIH